MRFSRVAVSVTCAAAMLPAQEFRATISGSVTDPAGAAVPNATVTVVETRTGTKAETVSDAAGAYTILFLAPGMYDVAAQISGFKHYSRKPIQVGSGDHPVIDIRLEVGDVSQSIDVNESVLLVNVENASVAQAITTRQVEDFPLNGRAPMMLAQLSIGVISMITTTPTATACSSIFATTTGPKRRATTLATSRPEPTWRVRTPSSMKRASARPRRSFSRPGSNVGGGRAGTVSAGPASLVACQRDYALHDCRASKEPTSRPPVRRAC